MSIKYLTILLVTLPGLAGIFSSSAATIKYTGVNLFGAEFGEQNLPGIYISDYVYPNQTEVDYFRGKGMNVIRLPFRWERLQRTNNANLDPTELGRLNSFVAATTAKGVFVILDPHNFARYYPNPRSDFQGATNGLLGTTVPYADFGNFWSRIASIYKTNDHVIFNLMNEPANMLTEHWLDAANTAIAAIRATGSTNLILVPGNGYTGAWTWFANWYGTPNAQAMLNIVDSGNNYAYDVHQYLDSDGSGTSSNIGYAAIGADRLAGFTQWLKDNNRKGFLGEFAVAESTIGNGIGDEAISNILTHITVNADVWLGWTWWAAGPYFTSYMFSLEPVGGVDRPQTPILKNFIPFPDLTLVVTTTNKFQFLAQPGFVYQTEASPNLSAGSWTNYSSAMTGNGNLTNVTMQVGTGL
ncbi:MAG: glycoside hydrolase family 5 protein, partial [Verrucomicrobiota bacterium]